MKIKTILLLITLTLTLIPPAYAAPPCTPVIVQADDWLSKIAAKYLGDPAAYPLIVRATNEMAQNDNSFATIQDPNRIEPGQKLCIPSTPIPVAQQGPVSIAGENDIKMLFSSYTIKWAYMTPDGRVTACFLQYEEINFRNESARITWDCATSDAKMTPTVRPKFEGPKS